MPTARELLDQADALMRRNRSPIADDIPVLTDSVMPAVEARILRRATPPPHRPAPESSATRPDPIPTLTERVSPSPRDAVAEEGEPSDWLQLEGGEPSVIGEAPDSISIVPDVETPPPAEDVDIFAAEPEAAQVATAGEAEEAFDNEVATRQVPVVMAPPTTAAALAAEFADTMPSVDTLPPVEEAPEFEEEAVDLLPLPELLEVEHALESEPPRAPAGLPKPLTEGVPESMDEAMLGPPDPVPYTKPSPAQEQARWESMAEEIRMQVLQRIDLFTDTGLREQLGTRLQPIVDRASADLVATINQHVGELLRAYVAEAIEREIDNWKKNN